MNFIKKTFLLSLILPIALYPLSPLWEEDPHFQWYRCLIIENSIHTLEDLAEDMDGEMQAQVKQQLEIINFNMGLAQEI